MLPLLLLLAAGPELVRLHPLGARAGTSVEVEILGSQLETATGVHFDHPSLTWQHTTLREPGRVKGVVTVAPGAPLGAHLLRVQTAAGPSTGLLFNVGQFPSFVEGEQRTIPQLPVEIYGRLDGAPDLDQYWFIVQAGERWLFDLQAMEHGSAVEARLALFNQRGERVAFNDDRDYYDENPLLEHTFATAGLYSVKLDQYRGPRGFTFGKNNAYILRISSLPRLRSVAPLGARPGTRAAFTVTGTALQRLDRAYLTPVRLAEYSRMTYPYTMPIHFRPDVPQPPKITARVTAGPDTATLAFDLPATAAPGLWRLWLGTPAGWTPGPNLELDPASTTRDAVLLQPRQRHRYPVQAHAGQPLHFWTLSAQLGSSLDTVLTLRDAAGRKLAENDDVVAGYGGLLGNPDSSLFYTPPADATLTLEVRDRLDRGGPGFAYRLKSDHRRPGFQLFTTPENPTARPGGTATLKVHLVREHGFAGEVDIWVEGTSVKGRFRADQLFEPGADGADMLIPELTLAIPAPVTPGVHPLRLLGRGADGLTQEAHTATMIGPIYQGDWNFFRRPVAALTLTVLAP